MGSVKSMLKTQGAGRCFLETGVPVEIGRTQSLSQTRGIILVIQHGDLCIIYLKNAKVVGLGHSHHKRISDCVR